MKLLVSAFVLSSTSLLGFADNLELTPKLVLNKCCRFDQKLAWRSGEFRCVENPDNSTENAASWISREEFRFDLNATILFSDIVTRESSVPHCESGVRDYVYRKKFDLIVRGDDIFVGVNNSRVNYFTYPSSAFCVDAKLGTERKTDYLLLLCPCSAATCVQKCCSINSAFTDRCVKNNGTAREWRPLPDVVRTGPRYVIYSSYPKCDGNIVITQVTRIERESQLQFFAGNQLKVTDESNARFTSMEKYCVDNSAHEDAQIILHCAKNNTAIASAYGWLFLVGAVALLLTVLLTIFLPEMRKNFYGRVAFCHNVSLLIGSFFTGLPNVVHGKMASGTCVVLSFIIQFTFLATFFWLNVMCIDMSLVFGSMKPVQMGPQRDRKKLIYASVYAWGCSSLITLITVIVEFAAPLGTQFKPNFGVASCFFNGHSSQFLFFYGPMSILLTVNLFLFVFTAYKIITVQISTAILNNADSNNTNARNKQTLIMYMKLFTLMGVTWMFEIITWSLEDKNTDSDSVWVIVVDITNLLRGVFIFVIFCCRTSVARAVRDKLRCSKDSAQGSALQKSLQTSSRSGVPTLEMKEKVEKVPDYANKNSLSVIP